MDFLADLDRVVLNDRTVYIVFDQDANWKDGPRQALDRLAVHLRRKGAHVRIVPYLTARPRVWTIICSRIASRSSRRWLRDRGPDGRGAKAEKPWRDGDRRPRLPSDRYGELIEVVQQTKHVRYSRLGSWLLWDKQRWLIDAQHSVTTLAKQTVRRIYTEAADAETRDEREHLADWAKTSESESRLNAMVSLARCEVRIKPSTLDTDPWLLNVANGTIDLLLATPRYQRGDFITKLIDVEYHVDPCARSGTRSSSAYRPRRRCGHLQRAAADCATGSRARAEVDYQLG